MCHPSRVPRERDACGWNVERDVRCAQQIILKLQREAIENASALASLRMACSRCSATLDAAWRCSTGRFKPFPEESPSVLLSPSQRYISTLTVLDTDCNTFLLLKTQWNCNKQPCSRPRRVRLSVYPCAHARCAPSRRASGAWAAAGTDGRYAAGEL